MRQNKTLNSIFQGLVLFGIVFIMLWGVIGLVYYTLIGELPLDVILLVFLPIGVFVAWFYWGNLLVRFGKTDLAIAHYTNLLRLAPKAPFLFSNRALLHSNQAHHASALADYDKAIELVRAQKRQENTSPSVDLRSDLGGLYGSRASVHFANRQFEAAVADCDTGLAIPDLSPVAIAFLRYNRATALNRLYEYTDALIDIETGEQHALSLPPQQAILLPLLRSQKAIALHQLGRPTEAAAVWQTLIHTNPNYHNIEWLKNAMKWHEQQLEIAQAILTILAQQEKSA